MLGKLLMKDSKEHLNDPYPGLFQNPRLLSPTFDTEGPLVRYRILVDGVVDAEGEFHCEHLGALSQVGSMLNAARYAPQGEKLAEIEVYDEKGELIESDHQVLDFMREGRRHVHWASADERRLRREELERSMGIR